MWLDRVKKNIFPLSNEKRNISVALQEWEYLGDMYDPGFDGEQCQICGHPDIRYQFEIVNKSNGNILLIGSECVKKFNIRVIDLSGKVLDKKSADKKVDQDRRKLISNAEIRSVLNSLLQLSKVDDTFDILNFVKYYKDRGAFTPHQLFTIIWRLDKYKVLYKKSCFKTVIKKDVEKNQLTSMEDWKIGKIFSCLSVSQKSFLKKEKDLRKHLKNK